MAFKIEYLVLAGLSLVSCNPRDNVSGMEKDLSGVYVNTYTANVINPETGVVIGARTVRDSLFIVEADDLYEISNRKWMFNDYDGNGWVASMAGETDALSTYVTKFDPETHWLYPFEDDKKPPLFFEQRKIYRGEAKALEYLKVE
ncbi:hypothetical protein [Chryseolinea sp. H1M3-3]|uniref:hypothetical protein n=1 Tax=Chryseolinea sp. H1M3-3 TaxID=3034144 RepID=UPI0023EBDB09|nr:hypothetical protein [Chryseolinea sp. H1M3-3]